MTIAELITLLQDLPQNSNIAVVQKFRNHGNIHEIQSITACTDIDTNKVNYLIEVSGEEYPFDNHSS